MSAEGLERLAHLSLLDVAAQRVPLGIACDRESRAGAPPPAPGYAHLRMRVSLEAFLASKTRSQPPQAQVMARVTAMERPEPYACTHIHTAHFQC